VRCVRCVRCVGCGLCGLCGMCGLCGVCGVSRTVPPTPYVRHSTDCTCCDFGHLLFLFLVHHLNHLSFGIFISVTPPNNSFRRRSSTDSSGQVITFASNEISWDETPQSDLKLTTTNVTPRSFSDIFTGSQNVDHHHPNMVLQRHFQPPKDPFVPLKSTEAVDLSPTARIIETESVAAVSQTSTRRPISTPLPIIVLSRERIRLDNVKKKAKLVVGSKEELMFVTPSGSKGSKSPLPKTTTTAPSPPPKYVSSPTAGVPASGDLPKSWTETNYDPRRLPKKLRPHRILATSTNDDYHTMADKVTTEKPAYVTPLPTMPPTSTSEAAVQQLRKDYRKRQRASKVSKKHSKTKQQQHKLSGPTPFPGQRYRAKVYSKGPSLRFEEEQDEAEDRNGYSYPKPPPTRTRTRTRQEHHTSYQVQVKNVPGAMTIYEEVSTPYSESTTTPSSHSYVEDINQYTLSRDVFPKSNYDTAEFFQHPASDDTSDIMYHESTTYAPREYHAPTESSYPEPSSTYPSSTTHSYAPPMTTTYLPSFKRPTTTYPPQTSSYGPPTTTYPPQTSSYGPPTTPRPHSSSTPVSYKTPSPPTTMTPFRLPSTTTHATVISANQAYIMFANKQQFDGDTPIEIVAYNQPNGPNMTPVPNLHQAPMIVMMMPPPPPPDYIEIKTPTVATRPITTTIKSTNGHIVPILGPSSNEMSGESDIVFTDDEIEYDIVFPDDQILTNPTKSSESLTSPSSDESSDEAYLGPSRSPQTTRTTLYESNSNPFIAPTQPITQDSYLVPLGPVLTTSGSSSDGSRPSQASNDAVIFPDVPPPRTQPGGRGSTNFGDPNMGQEITEVVNGSGEVDLMFNDVKSRKETSADGSITQSINLKINVIVNSDDRVDTDSDVEFVDNIAKASTSTPAPLTFSQPAFLPPATTSTFRAVVSANDIDSKPTMVDDQPSLTFAPDEEELQQYTNVRPAALSYRPSSSFRTAVPERLVLPTNPATESDYFYDSELPEDQYVFEYDAPDVPVYDMADYTDYNDEEQNEDGSIDLTDQELFDLYDDLYDVLDEMSTTLRTPAALYRRPSIDLEPLQPPPFKSNKKRPPRPPSSSYIVSAPDQYLRHSTTTRRPASRPKKSTTTRRPASRPRKKRPLPSKRPQVMPHVPTFGPEMRPNFNSQPRPPSSSYIVSAPEQYLSHSTTTKRPASRPKKKRPRPSKGPQVMPYVPTFGPEMRPNFNSFVETYQLKKRPNFNSFVETYQRKKRPPQTKKRPYQHQTIDIRPEVYNYNVPPPQIPPPMPQRPRNDPIDNDLTSFYNFTADLIPDLNTVAKPQDWNVRDFTTWEKEMFHPRKGSSFVDPRPPRSRTLPPAPSHIIEPPFPHMENPFNAIRNSHSRKNSVKPPLETHEQEHSKMTFDKILKTTDPVKRMAFSRLIRHHGKIDRFDTLRSSEYDDVYQLMNTLEKRRGKVHSSYDRKDSHSNSQEESLPTFDISFEDWLSESGVSTTPMSFEAYSSRRQDRHPRWNYRRKKRLLVIEDPENDDQDLPRHIKQPFWTRLQKSVTNLRATGGGGLQKPPTVILENPTAATFVSSVGNNNYANYTRTAFEVASDFVQAILLG
jgi:hypothetical protein